MAGTLGMRPNHYDTLGLSPDASQEDVFTAFGKAMGKFGARPVTTLAEISIAFETLRNPGKRKAYDEAAGLVRKPEPKPAVTVTSSLRSGRAPFIAAPAGETAADSIGDRLARIAEPAVVVKRVEATPAAAPVGAPEPEVTAEAADAQPVELRKLALVGAGLLAAAGLTGALLGTSVKHDIQAAPAKADVTVPLPAPRPARIETIPAGVPAAVSVPLRPVAAVKPAVVHRPQVAKVAAPEASLSDVAAADPLAPVQTAADAAAAAAPAEAAPAEAAPVVAASLPLPKPVIARTIEKIGYRCGSVTSATAVDAAAGVFTINCSSGQTYRASPVGGRYHFKRVKG